ncbi:hypothetical protein KC926_01385 [Candidatus Kaiserbacteria bacterium]|nr:hypothetical protein [Candidatus Kaiserbacteria bacterium]
MLNIANKKQITNSLVALFLVAVLIAPSISQAATNNAYQPQTKQELIAYLQGRIAQLIVMQQMAERSGLSSNPASSVLSFVSIKTHKASDIEATTATLRGEALIYGNTTATVWFEYGQDNDFLDLRTSKVGIRTAYERAVRINVKNLEEDEKYYFRIVSQGKDGLVQYGDIYTFRTDESDN